MKDPRHYHAKKRFPAQKRKFKGHAPDRQKGTKTKPAFLERPPPFPNPAARHVFQHPHRHHGRAEGAETPPEQVPDKPPAEAFP